MMAKIEAGREKGQGRGDKIRSSLVWRFSLRQAGSLVLAFVLCDLLLTVLLVALAVWQLEARAQSLLQNYSAAELLADSRAADAAGIQLSAEPAVSAAASDTGDTSPAFGGRGSSEALTTAWFWSERTQPGDWLPLAAWVSGGRRFSLSRSRSGRTSWSQLLLSLHYEANLQSGAAGIRLSASLASTIRLLYVLLPVSGLLQLIYVLAGLSRSRRAIRRALRPLNELAAAANTLQAASQDPQGLSEDELDKLTGALSTIGVEQLDRRLEISSSQSELQALAQAINSMLERIRQGYASQVRFVSDASHELRTPLAVIQGYVALLERWGRQDPAVLDESIQAIATETQSMKKLIEQLLFLARGENNSLKLNVSHFDARELLEELLYEAQLIDQQHRYEKRSLEPAWLQADRVLIKQALRILMDNSVKYSPAGSVISLSCRHSGDRVLLQVQDNGIGMAPEDVPHIFDRFYRSDESRARKTGGSGLGLAIAQWIARRHSGYFEVISRLGFGTRVTLVLPASDPD
ncbi:MAG: ATP-binding protein [Oscillospiraceae bacterium]|nr:ATP-binding protein [Oscillospiraceae bacterium]